MYKIPRNRNRQIELLRSGRQKAIIIGGVPVPAGDDTGPALDGESFRILNREVRDEIDRKSPLVRGLPRSRFRSTFSPEARLPLGTAERLEDFEKGLRDAGFVTDAEMLVQYDNSPLKFRVKPRRGIDNLSHVSDPSVRGRPAAQASLPLTEDPTPARDRQSGSRAESGASLDADLRLWPYDRIPTAIFTRKARRPART